MFNERVEMILLHVSDISCLILTVTYKNGMNVYNNNMNTHNIKNIVYSHSFQFEV